MKDIKKANQLFEDAGLSFPTIPYDLATKLKERDIWLFSTRKIKLSPYNLEDYVNEVNETDTDDYAILSHTGHGVNSYAIQYYLIYGDLRMFLHLSWGGWYMDNEAEAAKIRKCFSLADQIVLATKKKDKFETDKKLTIVCSDFYGSCWSTQVLNYRINKKSFNDPLDVLNEVLTWLNESCITVNRGEKI